MKGWPPFAGVGLLAMLAGAALWLAGGTNPAAPPETGPIEASPAAIHSAPFSDLEGAPRRLGQFQGKVLVLNFWATWCAPCRDEMPAFVRLQSRWGDRGIQFVGLAQDDPAKVKAFAAELGVNYPLWLGEAAVMDLSRRLGNRLGVLPHTVLLDPNGQVLESRIGMFAEAELESRLASLAPKRP